MNHTIIHDHAGLNQFYAKGLCLCWSGDRIIRFSIRPYVDGLSVSVSLLLMQGHLWLTIATFAELALVFVAVVWLQGIVQRLFQYFYFTQY